MWMLDTAEKRYLQAVGLLSFLCIVLFFLRSFLTGHLQYLFIPGNLLLAWSALFFGWLLVRHLKVQPWSSWQNVGLTFIWLVFLPNTWYVLTDFIHLNSTGEVGQLFDIVLIYTFVFSGFTLGFTSLFLVHKEMFVRWGQAFSSALVTLIILLSSFAIYLGRDLRWSTWDVLANPSGLILNVSDRFLDPFGHPRALNVTALFFVMIMTMYFAYWIFARPAKPKGH